VQAERRNLDAIQLPGRAAREPRIFRDGETDFRAAFHANDDEAVFVNGGDSFINQGIHATSLLSAFYSLPPLFRQCPNLKFQSRLAD
jgi:hypothetical protein